MPTRSKSPTTPTRHEESRPFQEPAPILGRLAGLDDDGRLLVRVERGPAHPARLLADLDAGQLGRKEMIGREVLLVHLEGDTTRPVVIGLLAPLEPAAQAAAPAEIMADGQRLHIEAKREIVLKCGQGSITIREDGKIVIKGTHLLSRATKTQRIKGGRVDIN